VALRQRGIADPEVISFEDGPLRRRYESAGILVSFFPWASDRLSTVSRLDKAVNALAKVIRQKRPDVVFANTLRSFLAILAVKEFDENHFIFMATAQGTVKKTALSEFANPRKSGIIAINLDDDDYLIGAEITNGNNDIVLVSNGGKAVWFTEGDVRPMGRATRGVRGMKLAAKQQVLSLLIAENDQQTVLVATENGYGKRTVLADFRHSGRGTQGVKAIAISERNGLVVAAKLVNEEDEIMLITTGGILIRTRVKEIRELGRATQGVTLINLGEGEKLSGLEKIVETDDEE